MALFFVGEMPILALNQWPLPIVSSRFDKVLVVAEKATRKRGRKSTKGGKKKKRTEDEDEPAEEVYDWSIFLTMMDNRLSQSRWMLSTLKQRNGMHLSWNTGTY